MSASLRLRIKEFDDLTTKRGWSTDQDRAAGLKVSASTISRIRSGEQRPGGRFVDACVRVFGALAYDRLFERAAAAEPAEPIGDAT